MVMVGTIGVVVKVLVLVVGGIGMISNNSVVVVPCWDFVSCGGGWNAAARSRAEGGVFL